MQSEETNQPDRLNRQTFLKLRKGIKVGPFALESVLGRGGMGEVWRAIDPTRIDGENPGYVALKFLPREIQESPRELKRALDSFHAVHALQHANICPVYFLEKYPKFGYVLVMKYVNGVSLLEYRDSYIKQHGSFPLSVVVEILKPIAAALDYAHHPNKVHSGLKSVIHRDIKPENILITRDGLEIQIVDFGLAAQVRLSMSRVSNIEMDTAGTPLYMAPEQWRGQFQDDKTDQYALAVMAYELIGDCLPFAVPDALLMRHCVLHEPPPKLPDVPEEVNQVLAKALSKQRSDRYESCQHFVDSLNGSTNLLVASVAHAKVRPPSPSPPILVSPFDSTVARAGQKAWADHLDCPIEWTNSFGIKFRLIPPGEFLMGAPIDEVRARADEWPQHIVRLTEAFFLGVYPVTQSEYERVTGNNPSHFVGESNLPVDTVSWDDARSFLSLIESKEINLRYRLPTEAEWEYACRAGTSTAFWFGDILNGLDANCNGHFPYGTERKGPYRRMTAPVGEYAANPFGIFDQHGQVWEWCEDWYSDRYYATLSKTLAVNPTGPKTGWGRCLRGGSWDDFHSCLSRSAYRHNGPGYTRYSYIGFRAVCDFSQAVHIH